MDADPADIPDGFNYETHRRLGADIQRTATRLGSNMELHMMACHDTPANTPREKPCIGWIANQMGPGNNIVLRLRAISDPKFGDIRTIGKQRTSYAEILPRAHGDPSCTHPRTKPGLPIGRYLSEICCQCGAFRTLSLLRDMKSFWAPWEEYLSLVEDRDARIDYAECDEEE